MMAGGLVGGLLSSPSIPPSGSNGKKKWRSEGRRKEGWWFGRNKRGTLYGLFLSALTFNQRAITFL